MSPKPARSLFAREKGTKITSPTEIIDWFRKQSSRDVLGEQLETIRKAATAATTDAAVEHGKERGQEILRDIERLKSWIEKRDARSAASAALTLCERWMELRVDALLAPAVRSHEQRYVLVTPQQCRDALAKCDGNKTKAASALGISRPTLNAKLKQQL